jgi:hypothetical protein
MGSHRRFRVLVPLVSCLLAVLIVELLLALFYPIPFSLEQNMYFQPDPYTGYRHESLRAGKYPNGVAAIANSQGNRDAAVAIPKPAGTKRIMLIGNSFTVGANVEQQDAYPQVLEDLLAASLSTPIEVVNSAVGGWIPFQYAQYFEHYGAAFQPDLIVVGLFVGRDTYAAAAAVEHVPTAVLGRRLSREYADDAVGYWGIWVYQRSNIARALLNRGLTELTFEREHCDVFTNFYLRVQAGRIYNHIAAPEPAYKNFAQANVDHLDRIRALGEKLGAPTLVLIIPDEMKLNPALQAALPATAGGRQLDYAMPQPLLHTLLEDRGLPYLDLLDALGDDERCLYMDDTHWTADGHHLAAARLHDYLLANYAEDLSSDE